LAPNPIDALIQEIRDCIGLLKGHLGSRWSATAERIDFYGQDGELSQYHYSLSESEFVVACAPLGWSRSPSLFKLYWIAADGSAW
jgi:hypothetical protein